MEFNPYESPESPSPRRRTAPGGKRIVPFASAHLRAQITIALLTLNLVLSAALGAFALSQASLLSRAIGGQRITQEEASANDARINLTSAARVTAYVVCAIALIAWLHRTHRNLPALGTERLEYTPGWAIGGWFIPILGLVRPYQVVREVWLASNPKFVGDRSWRWRNGDAGFLLGLWWAAFVLMCILGIVVAQFGEGASLTQLRDLSYAMAAQQFVSVVAACLAIAVVFAIDKRQTLAYDAWCEKADSPHASDEAAG